MIEFHIGTPLFIETCDTKTTARTVNRILEFSSEVPIDEYFETFKKGKGRFAYHNGFLLHWNYICHDDITKVEELQSLYSLLGGDTTNIEPITYILDARMQKFIDCIKLLGEL